MSAGLEDNSKFQGKKGALDEQHSTNAASSFVDQEDMQQTNQHP